MDEKTPQLETHIAEDVHNWEEVKRFLEENKSKILYPVSEKIKFWKRGTEEIETTKKEKIYRPIWFIRGYYLCEYLRDNVYRIEIEDKVKKAIRENEELKIKESSSQKKFALIPDIIETVEINNQKTLQIKDYPQEEELKQSSVLSSLTGFLSSKSGTKTIDVRDLKTEQVESLRDYLQETVDPELKFTILEPQKNESFIINLLKEKIIQKPKEFKEILKQEFVLTDFRLIYCPVYNICLESEEKRVELEIDALTRELSKKGEEEIS